jgi:hypothetical protein
MGKPGGRPGFPLEMMSSKRFEAQPVFTGLGYA